MLQIVDCAPPVAEEDIAATERRLGITFPADLRHHYLNKNGGRPIPNTFHAHGDGFGIHQFIPLKYGKRLETLEEVFELMQQDVRLPKMAIPFAIDAGGDWYCYSIAPSSYGRIFCDQGDYFEDPERAICWLADTLAAFLAGLGPR